MADAAGRGINLCGLLLWLRARAVLCLMQSEAFGKGGVITVLEAFDRQGLSATPRSRLVTRQPAPHSLHLACPRTLAANSVALLGAL